MKRSKRPKIDLARPKVRPARCEAFTRLNCANAMANSKRSDATRTSLDRDRKRWHVERRFTAAEIARCLATSPQNVRKLLRHIPPTDKTFVSCVQTAVWSFDALPSPLLVRLAKLATRHGFSTPLQLLQNSPRAQPLPSPSQVSDNELARAQKLQRVLARHLDALPDASVAELARLAAPDYFRDLGKVSDRHLRAIITRTIKRDRGNRNFDRLDLYIADRPSKRKTKASPLMATFRFDELDGALATIRDRTRPTLSEIAYCWREVVKLWADRIACGADGIKLKRELRKYIIESAPFLGETAQAVKRALNRKTREAVENGIDTIVDGRLQPMRSTVRPSDADAMVELCAQHALFNCGKREVQAYRELHMGTAPTGQRFSDEFRAACPFDVRNAKSRMPNWFRAAVKRIIEATKAIHLGPRAARLAMPPIRRDWSTVLAGASYTSDDVTLNHYVYDWHDQGEFEFAERRFNVVRPQFLPVVDELTGNPLGFSLTPAPTYNSWQIRALITRICMREEIGLPFEQFLFERGIWTSRNVRALSEWAAIDESFERHGIRLAMKHATTPKAKIIEQVIGALQNLDEYAPGYIGRGEQRVKHERVQSFLQKLKRFGQPVKADVDPAEMLMSHEQCSEMLSGVLRRFADEPQNGERLQGLSPAEGWAQLSGGRAHQVLPETLRFVLATAESIQTVTNEGITLRIGRLKHSYCGSARLGEMIGDKVRVRFNPELPEHVFVSHIASDPSGLKPFSVPLFERVRAHNASNEEFARAREHQSRFVSYGRTIYRELIPKTSLTICRSDIGSPELRAAGDAHNRLERECIDLIDERAAERGAIDQLASRQNLSIDSRKVRRPARVAKHLRSAENWESRIQDLEREEAAQ